MTNLCQKVEKIEIEVKELKDNGQQHDQKHAELRRTADGKQPEIEGDDGKLRKTHNNVCSDTAAGTSKRTSEKPKNTNLNQLFAKPNNWFKFVFFGFSLVLLLVPAAVSEQTLLWVFRSFPTSPSSSGCFSSAERRSSAFLESCC